MTGFGTGEAPLDGGRVVVEVRGVNSRYLDVRAKLPARLSDLTMFVEQAARERLARGRFEVAVRTEGGAFAAVEIDRARAEAAFRALVELRDAILPGAEVPFAMLASLPDLFTSSVERQVEETRAAMASALGRAIAAMDEMREREGEALAQDLVRRAAAVRAFARAIEQRAPAVVDLQRRRLVERLERLANGSVPVDPSRIEQEVVMFADRCDICEELTRLESHLDQFVRYAESAEPVGRRLDFLLQEMAREMNTVGSKSQDATIAQTVVEAKAELERMREQVQNVE